MIKQLLFSAAVAAMAFSASAETKVLWTSEDPEGVKIGNWERVFGLTAEEVAEIGITAGDKFNITVTAVEEGWPQVAIFDAPEGWPPLTNAFAGGDGPYPKTVSIQINSGAMMKTISENGVYFSGGGVTVSEISWEEVEIPFEVSPDAVWFGPKACNWGDGIFLDGNSVFGKLAPGDKIVVEYDKEAAEHTLQFLLGGWGGLNVPTYAGWATNGFLTNDEEAGAYSLNFTSTQYAFPWEVDGETKEYDIYALIKGAQFGMHGPCTVNQILYLPSENNAAYNKILSEINAAQEKYEAAVKDIEEKYEGINLSDWKEMIEGKINDAKTGLAQAMDGANEDGETLMFPFDAEDIENSIAEMEKAAPSQAAYDKVLAKIEAAQEQYETALAEIEKSCPNFDLTEWKEIISEKIAQAKTGAKQALNAAIEEGEEFKFAFDAEDIENSIAMMEKEAANQVAYDKVMATINALQEEYDEAVETIKEVNPEFEFTEWSEIETMIAEAKKGASQALAVANEDGEEFTFAYDSEQIGNFIIEMKKTAYKEHNTLAYDKVVAAIAEVEAEYTDAVAEIEKEYPGIDLGEWKEIIGGQLDEIKKGAEQALAAANDNGELFNFAFDGEEYEGMIEEMQKAAPLLGENQAAYSKVLDEINAVEEEYNDAVEAIKEVNPDFDFADWTEIETQIAEAKNGAAQALDAANEDGEKYNFAFSAEDIENFIIEMKKAGFADYNQAAYDQAVADIAALEAKYDAAVVEIEETYPDYDLTEWKEIIGGDLAMAKSGAEQALAAANEDGEKFFFPVDAETFEGKIEQMKNDAKLSGIANIEAEIAAGKAKIFTLDGKAHFAPVKGQVNVIVRENSTVKVMVK